VQSLVPDVIGLTADIAAMDVKASGSEQPQDLRPVGSQRTAQLASILGKQARSQAHGQALISKIRDGGLPVDHGFPADSTVAELEQAYDLLVPVWQKNMEKDVEILVRDVQDRCASTMDADRKFRHLKQKVGTKLTHGLLTEEVLAAAQARCHEYWSRVTPGNVALIVEKVTSNLAEWKTAKAKFDWIWNQGQWQAGGRAVNIGGREYTAEDLEQAERRCREKYGLPAAIPHSEKRVAGGKSKPEEKKAPAEPAELKTSAEAVEVQTAKPEEVPSQAKAEEKLATPAPNQSNADFIAEHILKKCNSMDQANKFFVWLRQKEKSGDASIKGRKFTAGDVDDAEQRCKRVWDGQSRKRQQEDDGDDGSSSSSSSSSSQEKNGKSTPGTAPKAPVDSEKAVQALVDFFLKKTDNAAKMEKYFNQMFSNPGKKVSGLNRKYDQEELTQAWLQCQAALEGKNGPANKKQRSDNADFLTKQILRKCSTQIKAQQVFGRLQQTVGQQTFFGRSFNLQEITEAELRVIQFFESQEKDAGADSGSDESSSSSSDKPKRGRPRKAVGREKEKKKRMKRSGTGELLEGALFGSDSEDLSGEESLDEEAEIRLSASMLADLGTIEEEVQAVEDNYPKDFWDELTPEVLPGFMGFNQRATAVMCRASIGQQSLQVTFDSQAACPPMQPHQEAVGFLMHPKSPISRLLVDHPTGSGKTREMIAVLDNHFFDPRPKIPIFPKDPVCRNFYAELLRWPSKYRDYYCCERPADAAIASGKPDWKEFRNHLWDLSGFGEDEVRRLCYSIREVLEMKSMYYLGRVRKSLRAAFRRKHPGEAMPAAPLRALGYTSAGGSFAGIGVNGQPMSSLMKIGFARGSGNVYHNKVVLMDEAHNLVRSQTQYAEQLQRLRRLLHEARHLTLAGFTGTPILSEPSEGRQLLDIIKGNMAPEGDEGYLSSFPMRPQPLFPISLPRGLPDGVLTEPRRKQLIRKVEIHGEALKVYDIKRRLGLPGRRLRSYCNVSIFHAAFHDGRGGSKQKILAYPDDCCPKLLAIAQAIIDNKEKSVILTGRTSGYIVMLELMKHLAAKAEPPFKVATMNELSEFNHVSNLRGEVYRVLVADSLQCSEGVSFLSVRRTYLADVPVSPSSFIQQCGRSIRMYGHRGLEENEQTVTTQMYVSILPKWMRTSSLACWALRAQKKHTSGKEVEKRARVLTARLNRAGISSLEELKARLDAHGEAKRQSLGGGAREGLTVEDALTFLEQNGLWEEARLLRNADKKDKEREVETAEKKAAAEEAKNAAESQLSRGDTLESALSSDGLAPGESLGDDDFAAALGSVLEEELGAGIGSDAPAAAAPSAPQPKADNEAAEEDEDEEMKQEMEALRQEDEAMAKAEELDGEGGRKGQAAAATVLSAPVPMTAKEVASCLAEGLAVLRAACREAEKPVGKPADKEQPAQEAGTEGAEQASKALPEADGALPSAGPATEPELEIQSPVKPAGFVFGEEPWREALVAGLEKAKRCEAFCKAMRTALPTFDPITGDPKTLSIPQVRAIRDEVGKHEKVETLRLAVTMIKEVRAMVTDCQTAARKSQLSDKPPAATGESSEATAMEVTPAEPAVAPPEAAPPEAAPAEAAPAEAVPAEAPAEPSPAAADAEAAAPKATEAPAAPPETEETQASLQAGPSDEALKEMELAWRRKLAVALRELKRSDHVKAALEVAAPGLMEKVMDAEKKAREEEENKDKPEEVEEDKEADILSLGIGPEHVKRLHDELNRVLDQAEKGTAKPRALVRAMQMLYLSESIAEAVASLKPETADEEALNQLTERSSEFAPALEAMRSLAVDRQVFAHLADDHADEHPDLPESESEADDVEKELLGKKNEPAPVVLPAGWRLEWVKRKKKEMREFVDPDGTRYRSVKEVRAALLEWESRQAALAAAKKAAEAAAASGAPPPKRTRLRGKTSSAAFAPPQGVARPTAPMDEKAFAEDLLAALAVDDKATATQSAQSAQDKGALQPAPGAQVRLKGLMPKLGLNGKRASLGNLNASTGRWECTLETGAKVNMKVENMDILSMPNLAKRPQIDQSPARRVRARGRGSSQGRGRGRSDPGVAEAAPQAAPAEFDDEESD